MSLEYQCICGACEDCLDAIRRHEDLAIRASTPPPTPASEDIGEMLDRFEYSSSIPIRFHVFESQHQSIRSEILALFARLRSENERLAKDVDRLDWLDDLNNFYMVTPATNMIGVPKGWTHRVGRPFDSIGERCLDLRDAIDKARLRSLSSSGEIET